MEIVNTVPITLDFRKPAKIPMPQVNQYDTNEFEFTVLNDGQPADLSTADRIVANYRRPDKSVITREITAVDNVITYPMGAEEMAVEGLGELNVQLFAEGRRLSSMTMKVYVHRNLGAAFEGGEGLPLLQELFVEVSGLVEESQTNANYALNQGDYAKEQADAASAELASLSQVKTDAESATVSANEAADLANTNAAEAGTQGAFAKEQGDYAKAEADRLVGTDVSTLSAQLAQTAEVFNQTKSPEEVDVFLVYGQSNARGYAGNTPGDPSYKTNNVTIWDGTQEIPLTTYMPTQNDGNSTGNAWTAFSNEYARKTGRKAILANCAKGSQSVAELSKGAANTNYSGLVQWGNDIKSHIENSGKTVGKTVILWCQGEADSAALTPTLQYKTALEKLWTDIKTDIGADLFAIFTVGYYNDNRKIYAWAIQAVQRKFAKTNLDSIIAFDDIESLNAHGMKVDGVHLNQVGYNYMGERGAKSVVGTLFTDNSYQQEELIKRQGIINLDGSQEWKYYGGWLTANGWQPSTSTSRATSNVIAVTVQPDHLAITLADRVDYILDVNAKFKDITSGAIAIGTGVKPVFDQKIYNSIDSEGRTVLKLYFLADLSIRANMTTQAIDTSLMGVDFTSGLSASWGTGTVTITHPQTRKLSTAVSRDITTPYIIGCRGASTSTTVKSWNTSGALANSEIVVDLKEILISPSLLPTNTELTFSMIGTEKRDS